MSDAAKFGCTRVSECIGIQQKPDMPGHIYFAVDRESVFSDEQSVLKQEIEASATILRKIFNNDVSNPKFREYFEELLGLAQLGLVGSGNVIAARGALTTMQLRIVNEQGPTVKTKYLNSLGLRVVVTFVIFLVLGIVSDKRLNIATFIYPADAIGVNWGNYAYMLSVGMLSIWLSFATRKQSFSFSDFLRPEDDMMPSLHRIAYVTGFSLILALLCYQKIVGVSVASFSTDKIASETGSALVFGVICGLSERLLATTVVPIAHRLLRGLSQRKGEAE